YHLSAVALSAPQVFFFWEGDTKIGQVFFFSVRVIYGWDLHGTLGSPSTPAYQKSSDAPMPFFAWICRKLLEVKTALFEQPMAVASWSQQWRWYLVAQETGHVSSLPKVLVAKYWRPGARYSIPVHTVTQKV
ncbi:unnamed protein product, partial [Discosporangium mesarthrocarpum]